MSRTAVRSFGLLLAFCVGIFAEVSVVSYFGGTGDDAVAGAVFASDGSIILGGTSTSATIAGVAGTTLASGTGFAAKLDRTGATVRWLVRLPAVKEIAVGAGDAVYVLLDTSVAVLAADGSAFLRQGSGLGASTVDMDVAADRRIALTPTLTRRACILKVCGMGVTRAWRIVSLD